MFEKKHDGPVSVKFTVPSFRYNGLEYKSAEVEKAAEEGHEDALAIIEELVKIQSGVIEVAPVEEAAVEKTKTKKKKGEPHNE